MRKKTILSAFLVLCGVFIYAKDLQTNFNKVSIDSVYDGDTFKVYLACHYPIFCKSTPVRVRGVDAPEIKGKTDCEKAAAKKARAFTREFLKSGKVLLRKCERDKYFRMLCDVFVLKENAERLNLAEELLNFGLAVPYDGGTKPEVDWCDAGKNQNS